MTGEKTFRFLFSITLIWVAGCDRKSNSRSSAGDTSASSSSAAVSGLQKEAAEAVIVEASKHWVRASDGWISAYNSGNQFAPNYLRQLREITVAEIQSNELDDSDKLNNVQWSGVVNFKKTPSREVGDPPG